MATLNNHTDDQTKTKKRKKYVLIGLGLLATTALTFFGIQYWKKNKKSKTTDEATPDFNTENTQQATFTKKTNSANTTKASTTQTKSSTKTTSKSKTREKATPNQAHEGHNRVAESIKDFKAKYRTKLKTELTPIMLAKYLQIAYLKIDFLNAYKHLKLIHNIKEYVTINKYFQLSLVGRTRKTIVTALLDTFKTENARKLLFTEFKRIGLKQKGSQWTLGEIENSNPVVITTQETKVWKSPKVSVNVPNNMILGREICKRGTFTVFENQNIYYLVESSTISKQ